MYCCGISKFFKTTILKNISDWVFLYCVDWKRKVRLSKNERGVIQEKHLEKGDNPRETKKIRRGIAYKIPKNLERKKYK